MSVEEIKRGIATLSEPEQTEVAAFLFLIRQAQDPEYQNTVGSRLDDHDPSHWLTLEEFERRIEQQK